MIPLRVTALLSTAIVAYDDYTPSLDNILIWLLLDQAGKSVAPPTPETARLNQAFIEDALPLAIGHLAGEWYHQVSSPLYEYDIQFTQTSYKRWDRQEQHLDWEGRRRTWNSQGFHTKSWTHHDPCRNPFQIDWFCMGDKGAIESLLSNCHNLGKRRKGQVMAWRVQEIERDTHLYSHTGDLMRPIPVQLVQPGTDFLIRRWGWRSPVFLPDNITDCAMPLRNVSPMEQAA